MKLTLILSVLFLSTTAFARFEDYGPGDQQTTSWFSSWSGIKTKVKTFIAKINQNTQNSDRTIASTEKTTVVVVAEPIMEKKIQIQWQKNVEEIKSQSVNKVVSEGKKFNDANLVLGRNNIPVFEFKKYNEKKLKLKKVVPVPVLDVGEEPTLDPRSYKLVQLEKFPQAVEKYIAALASPESIKDSEIKTLIGIQFEVAQKAAEVPIPVLEENKKITQEKINKIVFNATPEEVVSLLAITEIKEEDLKMLRALILYEKKDYCHIASGIFYDLTKSTNTKIQNSARYHLASCLQVMRLPTSAIHEYIKVVKAQDDRFLTQSTKALLEIYKLHNIDTVAEALLQVSESSFNKDSIDELNYVKARYYYNKDQTQNSLSHALKVSEKSKNYFKAQYLASVAEYNLGKSEASETRSQKLIQDLTKRDSVENDGKEVLALAQIHLGRLFFQKGKFKDSLNTYKNVSKDNSLWLQALTEQGWSQLQAKDAAGAIGNMHSIHSPYFEGVYKPESYIVRGIGYLQICQYPDAFRTISLLEQKYVPWLSSMENYLKKSDVNATYSTVTKYLNLKKPTDTDGLPVQVIKEIARQKEFLNKLNAYNTLLEEDGDYGLMKSLIDKDKKALTVRKNSAITKIVMLKDKIKKAPNTPGAAKNIPQWKMELAQNEDFLATYDFKMLTYNEGEAGLKSYTTVARDHLSKLRQNNKENASRFLKSYLQKITKELKKNLENNELLKYEIYAGSGENIRYQMAGGKTAKANAKNADRGVAGQNWDFQGEFWEDEIGNYRSSLKNNCKKEN